MLHEVGEILFLIRFGHDIAAPIFLLHLQGAHDVASIAESFLCLFQPFRAFCIPFFREQKPALLGVALTHNCAAAFKLHGIFTRKIGCILHSEIHVGVAYPNIDKIAGDGGNDDGSKIDRPVLCNGSFLGDPEQNHSGETRQYRQFLPRMELPFEGFVAQKQVQILVKLEPITVLSADPVDAVQL